MVKELLSPGLVVSIELKRNIEDNDLIGKKVKTNNMNKKPTMLKHNFISGNSSRNRHSISQGEHDEMILELIINASLTFNLVHHESFEKLINQGFPGKNILRHKLS